MSGHSKWKNIMHKKEKTDAQRAKIFTKIGRELAMIVKEGGPDPTANSRLKDAIAKAKVNNVPNDNIERIIKKASGEGSVSYVEMSYEGYGPCGVAVIVETVTDNKNRTAGDLRHYFDKFGGNLGQSGSVSWQFEKKGVLVIELNGLDEEKLVNDIIDSGADDYSLEDDICEIYSTVESFPVSKGNLEAKGYKFLEEGLKLIPSTYIDLNNEDDIKNMNRLLEQLDDNDDVVEVYHNWGNEE